MFSSLPKLVDKNFVLGFLLPVLLAAFAALLLLHESAPSRVLYKALADKADFSAALALIAVAVWTVSVFLMLCNHTFYQCLEGYVGPFAVERWRKKLEDEFVTQRNQLDTDYAAITAPNSTVSDAMRRDYFLRFRSLAERFPHEPHLVLPTRFGNIIRAFETYPLQVYGIDSIPAWIRMAAVIPKEFAALIDDSRAEVNFFVNTVVLATLLALVGLGLFVWDGVSALTWAGTNWDYLLFAIAAFGVAGVAYHLAVDRAAAWGTFVKAAFDLYLPALAKQLGYKLPDTKDEREKFWDAVNSMLLYLQPLDPQKWTVAEPAKAAKGGGGEDKEGDDDKD